MDPGSIHNPFSGWSNTKPISVIDDGLLPDDFSSKYDNSKLELNTNRHKWYAKYLRDFVKLGAHVCRLDFRRNFESVQKTKPGEPLWADILHYFYCYFTIKMIVAGYHHYLFEYHKYGLNRFDQMAEQHGGVLTPARIQYRQMLVASYEQSRSSYKAIGAPFMHLSHLALNGFVYFIILIYIVYMYPQQYYKLHKPFDYSIIYTMIAPHRLQKSIDSIICEAVNSFIVSSKAYNRLLIEQKTCDAIFLKRYRNRLRQLESESLDGSGHLASESCGKQCPYRDSSISETNLIRQALTNEISHNHQFFVRQIKFMALNGCFQPINRRQKWLTKIGDIYGLTLIGLSCYGLLCMAVFTTAMPFFGESKIMFEKGPLDLLFHAEILLMGSVGSIVGGFYITLTTMICLDQAHVVSSLNQLISECISTNTYRLRGYVSCDDEDDRIAKYRLNYFRPCDNDQDTLRPVSSLPARRARGTLQRASTATIEKETAPLLSDSSMYLLDVDINLSLMFTLMHYKIFAKHLGPTLDTLPLSATGFLFVMFLPVMITRLLIAYLVGWQKIISLLVCALILTTAGFVCSMMCWLHSRCLDIYCHLQSLMAHTNAMNHAVKVRTNREAYDNHLMWMLHRELSYPEKLVNQCATPILGMQSRMTYAFLLKCVFWWGLLAISIITIDTTRPDTPDLFGHVWRFFRHVDDHIVRFLHTTQ